MGLEFRIGNRKVSQHEWERNLKRQVIEAASEAVEKRIRGARCPEHHQAPTNIRSHKRGSDLEWTFSVCCERGKAAAQRAISA